MDINEWDEAIQKMLERFKLFNIYDVDNLIVLLATIVSQLKNNTAVSKPSLIIIDSLSSMISGIQQWSQAIQSLKEVLTLLKTLNKWYFIMTIFTNNAHEGATKITNLYRLVQEPMVLSVDKSIYCVRSQSYVEYLII